MKVSDILLCGGAFAIALPVFMGIGAVLTEQPQPEVTVRQMTDEEWAARSGQQQKGGNQAAYDASSADICRAAIATLFGRDIGTIRVVDQQQDSLTLIYVRPDDGSEWNNRCKVVGDRVMWAADPGGRWRDNALDEKVTYQASGRSITITMTYPDGSGSQQVFNM